MRRSTAFFLTTTLSTRVWVGIALGVISSLMATDSTRAQTPVAAPAQEKGKTPEKDKTPEKGKAPETKAEPNDLGNGVVRISDITNRYHFSEKYNPLATQSSTNQIGQYRVASKFTIKTATDRPEGSPERTEGSTQVIYTERPAIIGVNGQVLKTVRQFEKIRVNRLAANKQTQIPTAADGLLIWYESRLGVPPLILSISPNRQLQELEYQIATTQVFMPDLTGVLPNAPSRIGDSWRITRPAVQAFLGERQIRGDNLLGRFVELRKDTKTGIFVAVISIQGTVTNQAANTVINAEVRFTFVPPTASNDPNVKAAETIVGKIEAQGSITDVRMGLVTTVSVARGNTRLKQTDTRELILERRPAYDTVQLQIPSPTPTPTDQNSWITSIDPKGRFQFRHPQDLIPEPANDDPDSIILKKINPEGPDIVVLRFSPDDEDQDDMYKKLKADWEGFELKKVEVRRGEPKYLLESDWPDKRTYHVDAAIIARLPGSARTQTIFNNYYLIRFRQKGSLIVQATTMKDPSFRFRREVEDFLKTFKLSVDAAPKL